MLNCTESNLFLEELDGMVYLQRILYISSLANRLVEEPMKGYWVGEGNCRCKVLLQEILIVNVSVFMCIVRSSQQALPF